MSYEVKDSGVRQVFDSGMVRDVSEDKTDYTLALDGPMFDRWAEHLTKGAVKYDARNWMKADGEDELARFSQSALRHFLQWFRGDTDEDHAAAVFFNINGAEYVEQRMLEREHKAYIQNSKREYESVTDLPCNPEDNCPECNGLLEAMPDTAKVKWVDIRDEATYFGAADELPVTAKVGDVDANDILDAVSQPGGAGDLAEDYNYLRNRVADLSNQLNRGVVSEIGSENDPYFYPE